MSGKKAERLLDEVGITVNKNTIPGETRSPMVASGIRIGSPAITTRGFGLNDAETVANIVADVLLTPEDATVANRAREAVIELTDRFPLPGLGLGSIQPTLFAH